jgi:TorA maturation chaperone TorD
MGSQAVATSGDDKIVTDEELVRAQLYGLLAKFLSQPPSADALTASGALQGDDSSPLGSAIRTFARVASATSEAAAADEYQNLFIGVGRGELLPFGSYYLTGFLNEKPLAKLRSDMSAVGIARREGVSEPEDHAASVLEVMAGLIDGRFGEPAGIEQQQQFFEAHIQSWMPVFFRDLAEASSSVLYAALADVGSRFLEIEAEAFRMD